MVSRSRVQVLVKDWSLEQYDTTAFDQQYADVVADLQRDRWITKVSRVLLVEGQGVYAAPDATVAILGAVYDDRWLDVLTEREAEAVNPRWRMERGDPEAIVYEGESARSFRVYPAPALSTPPIPLFPAPPSDPLDDPYVQHALYLIHTDARINLPDWLDVPLALSVLVREYARESNHQDATFSDACRAILPGLLEMVR